jgi:capsular polysaccharide biosynthesis protein
MTASISRFAYRIHRVFSYIIPCRIRLKPKGVYTTPREFISSSNDKDAVYHEIYSNLTTTLKIPEEEHLKYPDISVYDQWRDKDKTKLFVTNSQYILELHNGRVVTNNRDFIAVISSNNNLVGDVSYQWDESRVVPPEKNRVFRYRCFPKPKKLPGTALLMLAGGCAGNNYNHWLVDILPRIHLAKKAGLFEKIDWFILPRFELDYQKDSLSVFGISKSKVIVSDLYINHYQADRLLAPSYPRGQRSQLVPKWITSFLHESLSVPNNSVEKLDTYPEFLFVNREDASYRHIVNSNEINQLLNNFGFVSVALANYSLQEKVQLFKNAKVIVAISGTSLTNLAFCLAGTYVIELVPACFAQYVWRSFSSNGKLKHQIIFGESNRNGAELDWHTAEMQDFYVDVDELRAALKRTSFAKLS